MKLEDLDHVAIAVADPAASEVWYREVLGLERHHQEVWGDSPIFMLAGSSGLAIFPRSETAAAEPPGPRGRGMVRHLAFRADRANFDRARRELEARGIVTKFQDHRISQSIYFEDPDGLNLEVTTYGRPAGEQP